jgi:mTERF domain-containing protein
MNSILVLLADLGVSKKMLIPLLTSSPQLLLRKPNDILQVHSYMYALSI